MAEKARRRSDSADMSSDTVGRYLQRKRFLSLQFEQATMLSITPVNRARLFERHPVFFVRTKIT